MLNILFITADQWRGECLGFAGHPVVRTPHIDALAADGTAFLSHYSNAAPCSPARACLYTGLYQMTNRVVCNGTPHAHRFDNVALAARRVGYTPMLFGYTDQSADPTILPPGDPRLKTYEGVLPGFDIFFDRDVQLDSKPARISLPLRGRHHFPCLSALSQLFTKRKQRPCISQKDGDGFDIR